MYYINQLMGMDIISTSSVSLGFLACCSVPLGKEIGNTLATVYKNTIGDNVIAWSQKTDKSLKAKNITPEQCRKAMENTDTSTKVLETLDKVKNKTDDFIQQLFAEIMASEIEQEGSYSLRTIQQLSLMTRKDLEYFYNEIAPFCFPQFGLFKLRDETNENLKIINLDITLGEQCKNFKNFESTDERFKITKFFNDENLYIQGKNMEKLKGKIAALNEFGEDLCKLGIAEGKIRKWTEEDKGGILRVLKACGIEEEEVKFKNS